MRRVFFLLHFLLCRASLTAPTHRSPACTRWWWPSRSIRARKTLTSPSSRAWRELPLLLLRLYEYSTTRPASRNYAPRPTNALPPFPSSGTACCAFPSPSLPWRRSCTWTRPASGGCGPASRRRWRRPPPRTPSRRSSGTSRWGLPTRTAPRSPPCTTAPAAPARPRTTARGCWRTRTAAAATGPRRRGRLRRRRAPRTAQPSGGPPRSRGGRTWPCE